MERHEAHQRVVEARITRALKSEGAYSRRKRQRGMDNCVCVCVLVRIAMPKKKNRTVLEEGWENEGSDACRPDGLSYDFVKQERQWPSRRWRRVARRTRRQSGRRGRR